MAWYMNASISTFAFERNYLFQNLSLLLLLKLLAVSLRRPRLPHHPRSADRSRRLANGRFSVANVLPRLGNMPEVEPQARSPPIPAATRPEVAAGPETQAGPRGR
jgi:hypothetical protein